MTSSGPSSEGEPPPQSSGAEELRLRRLLPEPGETLTPDEAASGLALGDLAPPDRPYLVLNMVATLDGRAAIDGRTKGMGSEADRALFHQLRTQADAVMAGAGTLRAERYRRIVRDPELRAKREREGLASDPIACVVSAGLEGLEDLPLLSAPEQRVLVLTAAEHDLPRAEARVEYVRAPASDGGRPPVDLSAAFARLRREHDVRSVLCEGGPHLNAELLRAGLVDELFLCVAPKLVGGADPLTIVTGQAAFEPAELELVSLLERHGELFVRARLRGRETVAPTGRGASTA